MENNSHSELQLQLEGFNGPLDLLLHLVRKQKMTLTEINVTHITEQYADYLKKMEQFNLDIAGEYFVMASTLMLMKAKSLIPREQDSFEEMREELIFKLEEYEKILKQVEYLDSRKREAELYYSKGYNETFRNNEKELIISDNSVFLVVEYYARVMERLKAQQPVIISQKSYSMKEVGNFLYEAIAKDKTVRFSELVEEKEKGFVVYMFVAILDMIKYGLIKVTQTSNFHEIVLIRNNEYNNADKNEILSHFES